MKLNIKDLFNKELPSDPIQNNDPRLVFEACFSFVAPLKPSSPELVHVSKEASQIIGVKEEDLKSKEFFEIFSGSKVLEGTSSYAMCYGGHQFGQWAGQLGDGRAINLFEVEEKGDKWMVQLKGAGKTPYSRRADGLAVLRSSIREHLCSEAMHHLGVPTTRSMSLFLTGDKVLRDVLYNGNPAFEKGAVVCRVAPSFIRFGNFEIFAAREDIKNLKLLADYTIKNYFPSINLEGKAKYLAFFKQVCEKTLDLILHWQRVGFVHGVMNTDNMSIHGITIDYGPYGWLEDYNPKWTPNTTDHQFKRYRFENQPIIAQWNLLQLANALYPLIEDEAPLEAILNEIPMKYDELYYQMMHNKIGCAKITEESEELIDLLILNFSLHEVDMTLFFRLLANVSVFESEDVSFDKLVASFYNIEKMDSKTQESWKFWLVQYLKIIKGEGIEDETRKQNMNQVNPKYVLRNYMAQLAIDEAEKGNYDLINEFHEMLKKPYDEQPEFEKWFVKRPDWAKNKIGCSALSCSS